MKVQDAIDTCIQCGFCLQSCPTYRIFRTEESSPRGRIARLKDVLAGTVEATPETLATFEECLGCRACEVACPSGVPYEEILLAGRARLRDMQEPPPAPARLTLRLVRSHILLRAAKGLWQMEGRRLRRAARRLHSDQSAVRLLAAMPEPEAAPTVAAGAKAVVQVHRGCVMDVVWPRTNARAVLLLREAGITADLMPASTGCCGALHAHQGDLPSACELARGVIAAFESSGGAEVVSLAGGCAAHMKTYGELLADDPLWHERAERFTRAVEDVTTLLDRQGYRVRPPATDERITYQDSCHLRNGLKVQEAPRRLIAGDGYCEMAEAATCCGSAGIYNVVRPDVAQRMLQAKVADIIDTGATTVITANPGCELQLRLGARETGDVFEVKHIVDWLWQRREEGVGASGAAMEPGTRPSPPGGEKG